VMENAHRVVISTTTDGITDGLYSDRSTTITERQAPDDPLLLPRGQNDAKARRGAHVDCQGTTLGEAKQNPRD